MPRSASEQSQIVPFAHVIFTVPCRPPDVKSFAAWADGHGHPMLWNYPEERYYDRWYTDPPEAQLTDAEIKSRLVERLRVNPATKDETLRVDVKMGVVILNGTVPSTLAKRAAGDDAWDTPSVTDVSNQIMVDGTRRGLRVASTCETTTPS